MLINRLIINAGGNVDTSKNTTDVNATVTHVHTDINPNYGSLLTNAAITGIIAGVSEVGVSKLLNMSSKSAGAAAKGGTDWSWVSKADTSIKESWLSIGPAGHQFYPGLAFGARQAMEPVLIPEGKTPDEPEPKNKSILIK